MTQHIYYDREERTVDKQKRFYKQGDVMVNRQGVPYRLTTDGWKLIRGDEWLKIVQIRAS